MTRYLSKDSHSLQSPWKNKRRPRFFVKRHVFHQSHRIHGTNGIFTYIDPIKNQPFTWVNIPTSGTHGNPSHRKTKTRRGKYGQKISPHEYTSRWKAPQLGGLQEVPKTGIQVSKVSTSCLLKREERSNGSIYEETETIYRYIFYI